MSTPWISLGSTPHPSQGGWQAQPAISSAPDVSSFGNVQRFEGNADALSPLTLRFPDRKLGDGTFGSVWAGVHLDRLGGTGPVPVAIKMAHVGADAPKKAVECLMMEASIMARLHSVPQVPRVYDWDAGSRGGQCFMAMQYLGPNLEWLCRNRSLRALSLGRSSNTFTPGTVYRLASEALSILEAVHNAGYLH